MEQNNSIIQEGNGRRKFPKGFKVKKVQVFGVMFLIAIMVLGVLSSNIIGKNDSGYYVIKQSAVAGNMTVISKPGMYLKTFGKISTYKVSETYYFSKSELDGGKGAESNAIFVRFSGGGTADVDGSVKFRLPSVDDKRLKIHEEFTSNEAVIQDLIRQYVQEVLKNTATLYKPEQTYSGGRGEFVATFQDQLAKGLYQTESVQQITVDADGNELTETKVNIIYDADGNPKISKVSPFVEYGIGLIQVSVKDIDYDAKVDELITAKQVAEQQKVLAKTAAEKARQDAITAEEEGKARVAKAKADAEVAKQTSITKEEEAKAVAELKAEKEKNVATTNAQRELDVATLNAESAKKDAEAMLTKKQAEAKANELLVEAGLTPLQKAQIEKEIAIGVARELANMNVPQFVITGGDSGGSVNPLDLIGINQALDIADKLEKQQSN